jgi:hypothetical protein
MPFATAIGAKDRLRQTVELGLLADGIDEPVLAHALLLVLVVLLVAVAVPAVGAHDLDHQIGGAAEIDVRETA